ncbi:K(+) efflux antiporter 4-like [Olea europaea var. sylvestris]|uniref:K(+) efflux antiporter 4-like n=1 Tax=Olea europaea var. sylvestris TaxID=158386 RepID=UPI000C1CCF3E|nr:K(+) efflux antiporter 4-like [Olea europaea var. sylvestris]
MRTLFSLVLLLCLLSLNTGDSNPRDDVVNGSSVLNSSRPEEHSLADMIDRALEKEFNETDEHSDVPDHGSFNNSVTEQQVSILPC